MREKAQTASERSDDEKPAGSTTENELHNIDCLRVPEDDKRFVAAFATDTDGHVAVCTISTPKNLIAAGSWL